MDELQRLRTALAIIAEAATEASATLCDVASDLCRLRGQIAALRERHNAESDADKRKEQ